MGVVPQERKRSEVVLTPIYVLLKVEKLTKVDWVPGTAFSIETSSHEMGRISLIVLIIAAALGSTSAIKCYTYITESLETPASTCTPEEIQNAASAAAGTLLNCKLETDCDAAGLSATKCVRVHQEASGLKATLANCAHEGAGCATLCPGGSCPGGACSECSTVSRTQHPPILERKSQLDTLAFCL